MQAPSGKVNGYAIAIGVAAMALLRLCFAGVLWSDEDYHLAAALHILHGLTPYRDFWYDKPPLAALYYLAMGAAPGVWLRLWDAAYILLCSFFAYRLARDWWGELEGRIAALLLAFFTAFYLAAAVIPFAPDALLIGPHLAAVYYARRRNALAAGLVCGIGFWLNVKALFVMAACAFWVWPALLWFGSAVLGGAGVLWAVGGWHGYWEQVWIWGLGYAAGAPVAHGVRLAFSRVGNWLGFHLALAAGAVAGLFRAPASERAKLLLWLGFSFLAVCFGNHFAPRYFLQMLPPLIIVAARGFTWALESRWRWAIALCLLVPLLRFAPRYATMGLAAWQGRPATWADVALNVDSQDVARRILGMAQPKDTLFVWGYRPDMYVYTRLKPASLYWDSQPLSGVAADRHLSATAALSDAVTGGHLAAVVTSRPVFFVDGLGLLNAKLAPQRFSALRELLAAYSEVGRTKLSVIYRRR